MFPVLFFGAMAGLLAWAMRKNPPTSSIQGDTQLALAPKRLQPSYQPPLPPQAERLLALLVLFARDKKHGPGEKQYLSLNTAKEAVALAHHFGLHKTANAIKRDGAVPDDEYLPGRTVSVRQSVISYGTRGRA